MKKLKILIKNFYKILDNEKQYEYNSYIDYIFFKIRFDFIEEVNIMIDFLVKVQTPKALTRAPFVL